ncbi:hypothetical protein DFQ30_001143, partial [Apophysomyces sp. BC1015]
MSIESSIAAQLLPITDEVRAALAIARRGCDELLIEEAFAQKLARSAQTGKPLRIKLGLDPTAPDIHIGHTVVLNKMRQLQDLGHTVIFLIGDFTSLIGDPSGRNQTRPPLTREQIEANAKTYFEQAALVLDRERTEIRYNSEWSMPLGADGMIKLASRYTVARMLERDGVDKMSKSKNNYVGISEKPSDMFGKLMSISDDLMWRYFELLSFRSLDEIAGFKCEVRQGRNPRDLKVLLAQEIVARFHSPADAERARQDFNHRAKGGVPDDIPEIA